MTKRKRMKVAREWGIRDVTVEWVSSEGQGMPVAQQQ